MLPETIDRLARRLAACGEREETIQAGLAGVAQLCPQWQNSGLLEVDNSTGTVKLLARHGPVGPFFDGLRSKWPLGLSPARELLASGVTQFIPDMRDSSAFPLYRIDAGIQDYRSVAMLLVRKQGRRGLVVSCHSGRKLSRNQAELPWLEVAVSMFALALQNFDPLQSGQHHVHVNPAMAKLAAVQSNNKLIEAANVFALHEGRFQSTADALGIHVSTLRYRLDRLRDKYGIDLLDRETRLLLLRNSQPGE